MAKTRLCNRDEWELLEALEEFRNKLQEIGISGMSDLTIYPDGNITANIGIDSACTMEIKIIGDGDYFSREYTYGNSTR